MQNHKTSNNIHLEKIRLVVEQILISQKKVSLINTYDILIYLM
jgi:hypothetical protein